jgi:hypothetical protein
MPNSALKEKPKGTAFSAGVERTNAGHIHTKRGANLGSATSRFEVVGQHSPNHGALGGNEVYFRSPEDFIDSIKMTRVEFALCRFGTLISVTGVNDDIPAVVLDAGNENM